MAASTGRRKYARVATVDSTATEASSVTLAPTSLETTKTTTRRLSTRVTSKPVEAKEEEEESDLTELEEEEEEVQVKKKAKISAATAKGKGKGRVKAIKVEKTEEGETVVKKTKPKKKAGALEEIEYGARVKSDMLVGAHISAAGGVENAVLNAASIGANAFALFLKSQRKWESPALTQESIDLFKSRMEKYGYDPAVVLPHGSYLINLGNPDAAKREKSYECFVDDLKRCEQLGLRLYNFHPGSTVGGASLETCLGYVAESINRAHKETSFVTIVIENMAGAGNVIGCRFSDLHAIIAGVEDKSRVGVCLDTCHLFASGYDIRTKDTYEATMADFDSTVGLKYLRAWHLNDSKTPLNSKKDRHENLGLGHIGLATFSFLLSDPRLAQIPMVLETPSFEQKDVWAREIEVLYSFEEQTKQGKEIVMDDAASRVKEIVKWAEAEEKKPKKGKGGGKRKKDGEDEDEECGSEHD